jgi:hypothetical protein
MPWQIKRLENGLLVQEYDQEPDETSEELLTPDDRTQDECYPNFAHLKPGEVLVLPEEPKKENSGCWYPSRYEDLGEFLNGDPGAIDRLEGGRPSRYSWRDYEPDESW